MNSYEVVESFEKRVADYAGSKYAVAVDSCTNALFLSCFYLNAKKVKIPKRTYVSVPCSIIHAGGSVEFTDEDWIEKGYYQLDPYPIYDAAHFFEKNMYEEVRGVGNSYFCISFSATKIINIGKGGMILTDDGSAVRWFKKARYCGRNSKPLMEDNFEMLGWNMYMTPEQAARGLLLMNDAKYAHRKIMPEYPDLSNYSVYRNRQYIPPRSR